MTVRDDADRLLRHLTGRDDATFREGQWEAIDALTTGRRRALVVQRTGWGKSAVYFLATRLLRDRGAGAAVLICPTTTSCVMPGRTGRSRRWRTAPSRSPTCGARSR